jgi:UDPglucose--hexose-1-phosphate uridylyltransferase
MQQLLIDELTGDRVILAPARSLRPDTFRVDAAPKPSAVTSCPFCEGNESQTPPEVARVGGGQPDTPGWKVRVVPNLYPIVGDGVDGAHEVIVLSPHHDHDFGALSADAAIAVFAMLRDRSRFHLERGSAYAQPFVNHGKTAGASIEHPHAQLVTLPIVPPRVEFRLKHFSDAALERDQIYTVSSDGAVVWCPPASPSPFFMRVITPEAGARFDCADTAAIHRITSALQDAIGRLQRVMGDPAYNLVVQTAPRDSTERFAWWVDIVPRVGVPAGFELGTGIGVNGVAPEAAAAMLRDA